MYKSLTFISNSSIQVSKSQILHCYTFFTSTSRSRFSKGACNKNKKTPAASLKLRNNGLGLPIHIKKLPILLNIRYYIYIYIYYLYISLLYIPYIQFPGWRALRRLPLCLAPSVGPCPHAPLRALAPVILLKTNPASYIGNI